MEGGGGQKFCSLFLILSSITPVKVGSSLQSVEAGQFYSSLGEELGTNLPKEAYQLQGDCRTCYSSGKLNIIISPSFALLLGL